MSILGTLKKVAKKVSGSGGSSGNKSNSNGSSSNSTRTPTTITDSNGQSHQGYIESGKTYYNDGSRIKEGSTVVTSNGTEYKMVNGQGVPTGNNYGVGGNQGGGYSASAQADRMESLQDDLKSAQLDSAIASLKQAKNKSLSAYTGAENTINSNAQKARNTNSVTSQQGKLDFQKYLASRGLINSGSASQGELSRNIALQNAQSSVESDRLTNLSNVANARANIESGYEFDLANAKAGIESQALQNAIEQANRNYENSIAEKQYNDKLKAEIKSDYIDNIGAFYNNYQAEIDKVKNDGDPSNDWQINPLNNARNQKMLQKAENDPSYATALQAYNRGIRTQQVLRILGLI